MNRTQLAHALRAAGQILNETEFVVVGSAAMFGSYPDGLVPQELALSIEADLVSPEDPEGKKATVLDGVIGELSPFHDLHGFHVDGVTTATARLAHGWQTRVVPFAPVDANGVLGWCLHPNDLAASKAVANREKDWIFLKAAAAGCLIDPLLVADLIRTIDTHERLKELATGFLTQLGTARPLPLDVQLEGIGGRGVPSFDACWFGFVLSPE